MPIFSLYLFGAPRLEVGGQVVSLQRRKTIAWLAYLAATGKSYTRDALAILFWPQYDQSSAMANLRCDSSRLGSSLGGHVLQTERQQVGVSQANKVRLDTVAFQQLVLQEHFHDQTRVCLDCLRRIEEGVAFYLNRFMAGFNTIDVRDLAVQIRAATLVMRDRGDLRIPIVEGELQASFIPGAHFVPLDSKNHILLETEPAWQRFLFEVETFKE